MKNLIELVFPQFDFLIDNLFREQPINGTKVIFRLLGIEAGLRSLALVKSFCAKKDTLNLQAVLEVFDIKIVEIFRQVLVFYLKNWNNIVIYS